MNVIVALAVAVTVPVVALLFLHHCLQNVITVTDSSSRVPMFKKLEKYRSFFFFHVEKASLTEERFLEQVWERTAQD